MIYIIIFMLYYINVCEFISIINVTLDSYKLFLIYMKNKLNYTI